jgi:hypothetical protein
LGDSAKDPQGQVALCRGDAASLIDQRFDVCEMPMGVLLGVLNSHVRRPKAALDHRLRDELYPDQTKRIDGCRQERGIDASVNECGECHVAADASRAIEVRDPHETLFVGSRRGARILVLPHFWAKVNQLAAIPGFNEPESDLATGVRPAFCGALIAPLVWKPKKRPADTGCSPWLAPEVAPIACTG